MRKRSVASQQRSSASRRRSYASGRRSVALLHPNNVLLHPNNALLHPINDLLHPSAVPRQRSYAAGGGSVASQQRIVNDRMHPGNVEQRSCASRRRNRSCPRNRSYRLSNSSWKQSFCTILLHDPVAGSCCKILLQERYGTDQSTVTIDSTVTSRFHSYARPFNGRVNASMYINATRPWGHWGNLRSPDTSSTRGPGGGAIF